MISAALFAQTSGITQQETKGKTTSTPSQIAVSDPGAPSKRTAAPAALQAVQLKQQQRERAKRNHTSKKQTLNYLINKSSNN